MKSIKTPHPLNAEEHRRRQTNLLHASLSVINCLKKHTIRNYLPGQVIYNLGEAPLKFSIAPTEYDRQLLTEFSERGAQLVQIHEDWNDPLRVMGADKFTSHDPQGLKQFIDLAHTLDLKILLYISSGFFDRRDPDFRTDWAHPTKALDEIFYEYAFCSPASPGWRAYLLPRLERILDDYNADGLYNDIGYEELWSEPPIFNHVSPEPETDEHDAALEDLLGIIYNEIHRRGGISKIHYNGNKIPKANSKVYDYLWVGETVRDLKQLRQTVKGYEPYVVPCPDLSRATILDEDELYLHFIPYIQFPIRVDGRPFTGERGLIPGMQCKDPTDFWTLYYKRINEYSKNHPDGPFIYNEWDSSYGRPEARERWFYYLNLYKPMVRDNSRCWIEVKETTLFRLEHPSDDVVTSLFVNEHMYSVTANYGNVPARLFTSSLWMDRETGTAGTVWTIYPHKMLFLRKLEEQQEVEWI